MKRLLLFIPIAFLFFVNACISNAPPTSIPDNVGTDVAHTQTATMWTVAPTQTFNPNITNMVNWLNADLVSSANSLGSAIDARYSVTDIKVENHSPLTFRINISCICMNDAECCVPERTFVVILEILKKNSAATLNQVPPDVSQIMVVCSNQRNAQIGAISVSWQSVQAYLNGHLTGYELGAQVIRTRAPDEP
jgi:hypothetical protein